MISECYCVSPCYGVGMFFLVVSCLFRTSDEDSGCAALLNWCWEQQKSSSFLSQRPLWPKVIAKQWHQNLELSFVCFKYLSIQYVGHRGTTQAMIMTVFTQISRYQSQNRSSSKTVQTTVLHFCMILWWSSYADYHITKWQCAC